MSDFLDRVYLEALASAQLAQDPSPTLADGTGRTERGQLEQAHAERSTARLTQAVAAAPGLRCEQCAQHLSGDTSSREALRRLTLRAEAAGWQTRLVDGKAMHWSPDHCDPDRERLRRLR